MTTAEDNFNKKGIDQDLDEEKKCCFCIGLEQGYNILGVLSWVLIIVWIYAAFFLYMVISLVGFLNI